MRWRSAPSFLSSNSDPRLSIHSTASVKGRASPYVFESTNFRTVDLEVIEFNSRHSSSGDRE
jgi:hypothetical protein